MTSPSGATARADDGVSPFWRRLHTQVFLTHLVVVSVVVGTLSTQFYRLATQQLDQVMSEELARGGRMAVAALRGQPLDDATMRRLVNGLGEETGLRVTVIRVGGEVVADSMAGDRLASVENHGTRPEVVSALQNAHGSDRRLSATVGVEYLYYAERLEFADGDLVVIRVALPYVQVTTLLASTRAAVGGALLLAFLIGGMLSLVVARRTTAPLAGLNAAAVAMAEGRFDVDIPDDPMGELRGLALAFRHLRTQLSDKLRQVEEEKTLLLTILGTMTEGVIVVDATSRVILVNPTALRLLGVSEMWTPTEVENLLLAEVTRHPTLIELMEQVIREGVDIRDEMESRRSGHRHLGVSVAPIREDDAVRGAVAALYDLTQVRQLERVRQDFVANVSHELRTPIAAIRGWAETLTSGFVEVPEPVEEHLLTILRHSERLAALVDDLLTLARVEALGIEVAFAVVDVEQLIDEVVESLRETIDDKEMLIAIDVSPEVARYHTEPRALEYVIRNLTENALKYTGFGGEVRIRARGLASGELELSVRDNGVGIEEHHLPRVFERFYRVDKGRSRDVGGTGLGLSIVKHFATALGGSVIVRSEVGQGSEFVVTLPVKVDTGA